MNRIPEKVCSKCGVPFPATTEFFALCTGGQFRGNCRACVRAYSQRHHVLNREARRAYMRQHQQEKYAELHPPKCDLKECRRCHRLLQPGPVHFGGGKGKNMYCRACGAAASAAQQESYRASAAALERVCGRCGVTMANTREFFYVGSGVCKPCVRRQAAEYARVNREVVRAKHNNRRARKKAAPGRFTKADVKAKLLRQNNSCYWCRTALNGDYHVDHVIPLSKGGTNGPENIVCACPACNLSKSAKMPWEFAGRLF